jgi:hypothetical protein
LDKKKLALKLLSNPRTCRLILKFLKNPRGRHLIVKQIRRQLRRG